MRVLLLHNRYQYAGGEDSVVQAEKALLESKGHQVVLIEVSNDDIVGITGQIRAALSAIYSLPSKSRISEAIAHFCPDVVHVHNFFPLLSPSVYDACNTAKVPVLQTLHNYRLGCPNAMLFRNSTACEDCLGKRIPWPGIVHACYRGSHVQSAVVAAMLAVHWQRGTWHKSVDAYIALTAFQKEKMVQAGLPREKIHIKPNYIIDPKPLNLTRADGEYALFVGRISPEKGIATLIDAYVQNNLRIPLKIAGTGPQLESLSASIQAIGLEDTIQFLGQQDKSAVLQLMLNAKFLIFPSIWYETFGLTMVEAFACGLPVLASSWGSMAEIVEDGITGLHFQPGNSTDLANKIRWAYEHPEQMISMGQNARRNYENHYTPEENYQKLMAIYQVALTKKTAIASHLSSG
ncbi:glycosyltransferase family 4 protein [Chlorogloeopsis fritschii PCC 9212]|nr:glycosyltransferase family 4 protein [Chlorogloeopsis fritschii]